MKEWTYGRLFRVAGIVAGVLACVLGLTPDRVAASVCEYAECESYFANSNLQPGQTGHECSECPSSPTHAVCGYAIGQINGTPYRSLVGSFAPCDCSASGHPIATPSLGFTTDPAGSCDAGCTVKCTGNCFDVEVGGKTWFYGSYGPDGTQCREGTLPPPRTQPPCDLSVGICYDPTGPKFCGQGADGGVVCVPSPRPNHGPDCGTDSQSALCAGTPNNPTAPPPSPPDPPITPGPDGQPPPPDVISNFNFNCQGGCNSFSSGPVTVTSTTDSGGGGGGGGNDPPGDDGGSGTGGSDGQTCPDGSAPVAGRCPAGHDTCPDGSAPVNGRCRGAPGQCADGSQPVNGVCGGGGNCSNGSTPVNGVCPPTCPDGTTAQGGSCQAPWANCQDGTPPVNGTCTPSACNPSIDPNHCEDAGTASGGGTCDAPPSCNGDQIACANLFQTWSTRCAVESLSGNLDNPETGHEGEQPSDTQVVHDVDGDGMLGQVVASGFWGGGACPTLPSFSVFGHSFSFSDQPWWCDMLTALAGIMLFIGAFVAIQILME